MEHSRKKRGTLNLAALLTVFGCLAALLYAAPAQAQASRTWVSGVGNDANPCSRTAPCKTFAGAISKTAAGGEINCLDSAGYGAVTMTKAISIVCNGVVGSVLVAGTNGIVVQAGPSDHVTFRGIEINGIGTGINGIRFLAGQALLVDNVQIYGFTTNGIDVALGATASVTVKDVTINNIGQDGIRIATSAGAPTLAADHVTISRIGLHGVELANASVGTVRNSLIFGANNALRSSAGGATLNAVGNTPVEQQHRSQCSRVRLFNNNQAVSTVVGANFVSGQNNKLNGNGSNGPPPSANMTNE